MSQTSYRKVNLPIPLLEAVREYREKNKKLAYTSDVDVIKDAIRNTIFKTEDNNKSEEIATKEIK